MMYSRKIDLIFLIFIIIQAASAAPESTYERLENENDLKRNSGLTHTQADQIRKMYDQCLKTEKSKFDDSPLVEKILKVCGGPAIFDPKSKLQDTVDVPAVMLELYEKFGAASFLGLYYFDGVMEIEANTPNDIILDRALPLIEKLSPGSKTDAIVDLINRLNELDTRWWYDTYFLYQARNLTTLSALKDSLAELSLQDDWYSFSRRLLFTERGASAFLGHENLEIAGSAKLFKIIDATMKQNDKKLILAYLFFTAIDSLKMNMFIIGHRTNRYIESECSNFMSRLELMWNYENLAKLSSPVKESYAVLKFDEEESFFEKMNKIMKLNQNVVKFAAIRKPSDKYAKAFLTQNDRISNSYTDLLYPKNNATRT